MVDDPLYEGPIGQVRRPNSNTPTRLGPAEEHESVWILTVGPSIWALHFLASYATAAIYCAKLSEADGIGSVRWLIVAYTGFALPAIGWISWVGYRRHRLPGSKLPHDRDTRGDRHRFLGFATLLLSALSGVAVIFTLLVALLVGTCD